MEGHFYTSVTLSSRTGGGLLLRLGMAPDCHAPLHFAAELFAGGYLIFERVSEPGVGVGAVYEAVRAIGEPDPGVDLVDFNPVPQNGGSSGVIAETRMAFDKMHDDRLKAQQIVASLLGSLSEDGRLSLAREDFLTREVGDALTGQTGHESVVPHALSLIKMRTLVERRLSGLISQSEFLQQATSLINEGLMSRPEQQS